ncbi:MAG: hypothetical protein ACO3N7_11535 [Kiritimatiellia bacterium]
MNRNSLRGISRFFCVLGTGLVLSSCASPSSGRPGSGPLSSDPVRSELVFLNIEEASGWVAYTCHAGDGGETENYRVVVIRQKSGEIIYDSQIPLAADLCTHGFEMSPEDPRLQRLARNVDQGIIEPLEAYQKSLEITPEPAPEPETRVEAVSAAPVTAPLPAPTPEAPAAAEESPAPDVQTDVEEIEPVPEITIAGTEDEWVLLEFGLIPLPKVGDRLFLRSNPKVIAIPGTNEKIITAEGQVTGLVEIVSVEGSTVKSQILSGTAPEFGVAEKVGTP